MIYFDDLKRSVEVSKPAQRILSLVPSITELLFDLGLEKRLVGRTNYCIHPKDKIGIDSVGGTKDFDLEKIRQLKPDLIFAVKEENNKELVLEIAKEFPVLIYDIVDLPSAIRVIKHIGLVTSLEDEAFNLVNKIQEQIYFLQKKNIVKKEACYLIWNKPMMSVGSETFISDMMNVAGFTNVIRTRKESYPTIEQQDIESLQPEYVFLSSEPFKFTEKHQQEYQERFPNSKVILVDGEMFSWYGSRMLKAFDYFRNLQEN